MDSLRNTNTENEEENDHPLSKTIGKPHKKGSPKRKLQINHKIHDLPRNSSFSSSSLATSYMKINSLSEQENHTLKNIESSSLPTPHFSEKYLPRGAPIEQLTKEMLKVIERKENEIQTLRVYRDELKFISFNSPYFTPIKLSLKALKGKAEVETEIKDQKYQIEREIDRAEIESRVLSEYTEYINQFLKDNHDAHQFIDIGKEEAMMVENKKLETAQIFKELEEQKRKAGKEIRAIQDEILDLRIHIKEKEDRLREIKARICTLYIKLHNRNSSRGSSQDRNLSMSVKKFNSQNYRNLKEAFIGNNLFKTYSRESLDKVPEEENLLKIRFVTHKQSLSFQCFYTSHEGIVHSDQTQAKDEEKEIKKENPFDSNEKFIEIAIKYLFSMKFYYKSRIVGVQCRVKTDKGTKNINVGNCRPHLEHELLTLANKRIITLGSYWHGKEMIGVSVWYVDKLLLASTKSKEAGRKSEKGNRSKQTFDEYYT